MKLSDIQDLVQIFFQFSTPIIAASGLWKWRSELQGKVEHETVKEVLVCAYGVRDAINMMRENWIVLNNRMDIEPIRTAKDLGFQGSYDIFNLMSISIKEEVQKLRAASIQAEAVFGKEAKYLLNALLVHTNLLLKALLYYHAVFQHEWDNPERVNSADFKILVEATPPDKDKFKEELDEIMRAIETYFRHKLIRKRFSFR